METSPVTCRTLEEFYHIDGHTFEKQYKEVLSGFRDWDQLEHADKWLLFPGNIGTRIAIDESSLSNGELLIRSRYLLFKSANDWTDRQKQRAAILFEEYPDIKKAYGLCHSLRMIFSKNTIKDAARLSMAKWYNKVEEAGFHSFNVIAATFHEHYNEILNFYNNRSSNAMAESFNAKIKLFRANLRGVVDKKFFLFRIANLYAYPH